MIFFNFNTSNVVSKFATCTNGELQVALNNEILRKMYGNRSVEMEQDVLGRKQQGKVKTIETLSEPKRLSVPFGQVDWNVSS